MTLPGGGHDVDSQHDQDMSDHVLHNYRFGEKLGQGSFGSVYRALNWLTGETVALKQVSLHNMRKQDLPEIMSEIDLLKKLDHPNIVQYRGFVKTPEHLYIILEYCENGSLQHITKKFGHFPESLVALYILQVLQGLVYLHEQGVIHRDIKASNILATKEGSIKLADFGVATVTDGPLDSRIVGSPYWMAPEVVEQTGATTASDVWSVGALAIELITGRPPYSFLDPMPALFRIVNDDCPPVPEGASAAARDFLVQCFQKDANLRVTAKKLLRHPWILAAKTKADELRSEQQNRLLPQKLRPTPTSTPVKRAPVMDRQQLRRKQSKDLISALQPRSINTVGAEQGAGAALLHRPNRTISLATSEDPTAGTRTPRSDRRRSLIQASPTTPARSSSLANLAELGRRKSVSSDSDSDGTIKASKPRNRLEIPISMSPITEDYSDLVGEDEAAPFRGKIRDLQSKQAKRRSLLVERQQPAHTDFRSSPSLQDVFQSEGTNVRPAKRPSRLDLSIDTLRRPPVRSQSLQTLSTPVVAPKTPSAARARFGEAPGEDYSDLLGNSRSDITGNPLKLSRRISSGSALTLQDDEDEDPFANMEDGSNSSDCSVKERNEASRLSSRVSQLCNDLHADADADLMQSAAFELVTILEDSPRMHDHFVRSQGLLALVEILQTVRNNDILGALLRIVNVVVGPCPEVLERFCLIGGCPVVLAFASGKFSREIRLEAALFIGAIFRSSSAAAGLKLWSNAARKDLVWMSVDGISRMFETQAALSRSDLCRIFVQTGLLEPLSSALLSVVADPDDLAESAKAKIVGILHLFSQADAKMKEKMATRPVVLRLVKVSPLLGGEWLMLMVKTIENLSTIAGGLDVLQNAGSIELLVDLLRQSLTGQVALDIQSHVVNALFNLCRLSKVRLEEAASAGAIGPLQELVRANSPLKQFALPMLCDFAHAGKVCRRLLWRHHALELYLELLCDSFWAKPALEALLAWFIDETAEVERRLVTSRSMDDLLRGFCLASSTTFESILEPFYKLLRLSDLVSASIATHQPFVSRLRDRLERGGRAVVRLNLLRTVKTVLDSGIPIDVRANMTKELSAVVGAIYKDDPALLVRELAGEVKKDLTTSTAVELGSQSRTTADKIRRRSSLRRTTSESAVVTLVPPASSSVRDADTFVQRRQSMMSDHGNKLPQLQPSQLARSSRTSLRGVLPFLS
ncbi:Protein kinase of the Mitotic Exit Network [Microbotryomycetes sp. JL201]|nr:Protein kinase of the Mitotic Exit Network [Microbotryomycetes sp. JL201]